jgi:hypothetical protein
MIAGPAVGITLGGVTQVVNVGNVFWHHQRPVAHVSNEQGVALALSRADLERAKLLLLGDEDVALSFNHRPFVRSGALLSRVGVRSYPAGRKANTKLHGVAAMSALARLLPALNRSGGTKRAVEQAVQTVESARSPGELLRVASNAKRRFWTGAGDTQNALATYSTPMRLALEMALHEDDERRAMAGELGALYARWEEAERVAKITDGELTPLPKE